MMYYIFSSGNEYVQLSIDEARSMKISTSKTHYNFVYLSSTKFGKNQSLYDSAEEKARCDKMPYPEFEKHIIDGFKKNGYTLVKKHGSASQ